MRIFIIIFIFILLAVIGLLAYVYINRQDIFDQSIDKILRNQLPKYIEIDSLKVDLLKRTIAIKGFKLQNPKGFQNPYLVEIDNIDSEYTQASDRNILQGIHLSAIELSGSRIFLERNSGGILNLEKMESVLEDTRPKKKPGVKTKLFGLLSYLLSPFKNISQLLQIEPMFNIEKGSLFFKDYYINNSGYLISIEDINGTITIDFQRNFKGINYLTSQGRGIVNAKPGQFLEWVTEYDPAKEKLTMNNAIDIENVDFTYFEPYYDKYSPFIFKKGLASGKLIINFDNAQISSDNEILFSGVEIEQKKDHNFNRFWPTGADDLYKYFSSEQGNIVFDFKIKGPMDDPRFYLGSKAKHALAYMVFDKITDRIFKKDKDNSNAPQEQPEEDAPQEEKTKFERILDVLQGF